MSPYHTLRAFRDFENERNQIESTLRRERDYLARQKAAGKLSHEEAVDFSAVEERTQAFQKTLDLYKQHISKGQEVSDRYKHPTDDQLQAALNRLQELKKQGNKAAAETLKAFNAQRQAYSQKKRSAPEIEAKQVALLAKKNRMLNSVMISKDSEMADHALMLNQYLNQMPKRDIGHRLKHKVASYTPPVPQKRKAIQKANPFAGVKAAARR